MIYIDKSKMTPEQVEWLENYEHTTTFEPIHQDDFTFGEMTFEEMAQANIRWFTDWATEAELNISASQWDDVIRPTTDTEEVAPHAES